MIPSTRLATEKPLVAPPASAVVPSIVKGMPQLLQLLLVMGLLVGGIVIIMYLPIFQIAGTIQ